MANNLYYNTIHADDDDPRALLEQDLLNLREFGRLADWRPPRAWPSSSRSSSTSTGESRSTTWSQSSGRPGSGASETVFRRDGGRRTIGRPSADGTAGNDPLSVLASEFGDDIEVVVVVKNGSVGQFRCGSNHQVRQRTSVVTFPRE